MASTTTTTITTFKLPTAAGSSPPSGKRHFVMPKWAVVLVVVGLLFAVGVGLGLALGFHRSENLTPNSCTKPADCEATEFCYIPSGEKTGTCTANPACASSAGCLPNQFCGASSVCEAINSTCTSEGDGCPDWAATDRLEQAGTIKGSLVIDGKSYAIDTTCARDHSWGTRNWDTPQHWKWLHAQAGADTCVHFWKIEARGRTVLRGYVLRDGLMAEVTDVDVDWENDDQYRHKSIDAQVRDTAGRTTRVTGQYFAHFPMPPVPTCTLMEGAMSCEIDGAPGVGWSEFMWPTAYLEFLRNERR